MTKEEMIAKMTEKQRRISPMISTHDYVMQCIEAMFDVAAEVLTDMKNDSDKEKRG